jgi:hypothetical protein
MRNLNDQSIISNTSNISNTSPTFLPLNELGNNQIIWNLDYGNVDAYADVANENGLQNIPDIGFTAQELKQAQQDANITIPGLVYESNPERLEASYGKLLPLLVKAIQELNAKVDQLNTEVATLKSILPI